MTSSSLAARSICPIDFGDGVGWSGGRRADSQGLACCPGDLIDFHSD